MGDVIDLELADKYLEMKSPHTVAALREVHAEAVKEFLSGRGIKTDQEREEYTTYAVAWLSQQKAEQNKKFDVSVLASRGITLSELDDMLAERRRKRAGGSSHKHAGASIEAAFAIFIDCENQSKTYAETINKANLADLNVTERTLRKWLSGLIKLGVCNIPPATRRKVVK